MNGKKNIGIFHYQVGRTDGVSLELEKWQKVFEEMGHSTFLYAGDLGSADGTLVEEMYHHISEIERLNFNTFDTLSDFDNDGYRDELFRWVNILEERFGKFIFENKINFLVPQNVWSVAANPAVGIALENVRRDFNLPALAHHHDFYWERKKISLTCSTVIEMIDKYYPPRDPMIKHVVINSFGKKELAERKGISSTIVPNVFDFDPPYWQKDEFNSDFRKRIGLEENDLLILQATRIVRRKGIELAIDFVKALDTPEQRAKIITRNLYNGKQFKQDNRIVLVLAGYGRDDMTGTYLENLKLKAKKAGVDMIHIEDMIGHERKINNGKKIYSLWDTYVFADFVTYPSLWEGWGNQFLEAIRSKLPIMIFEYPVFTADIKPKGFDMVSLGSRIAGYDDLGLVQIPTGKIRKAADEAVELLTDKGRRSHCVDNNFRLGKEHFSLDALRKYLNNLMWD
ncbi:MAG: glycosyltransferase family 4 protein [Chloroflexota bacterium]|nr:glycosyltransferase family 4 protein [Chloroflexota bacterium]